MWTKRKTRVKCRTIVQQDRDDDVRVLQLPSIGEQCRQGPDVGQVLEFADQADSRFGFLERPPGEGRGILELVRNLVEGHRNCRTALGEIRPAGNSSPVLEPDLDNGSHLVVTGSLRRRMNSQ